MKNFLEKFYVKSYFVSTLMIWFLMSFGAIIAWINRDLVENYLVFFMTGFTFIGYIFMSFIINVFIIND